MMGYGCAEVVSVLAFYSNNPILNTTSLYIFSVKLSLKITKINKKRPGWAIKN